MKSMVITKPREIKFIERNIPQPNPDEVLIKVMASGICGTDIHIFNGDYLGTYPVIPGHEFSGIIQSTGGRVSRFKVGDRVAVEPNIACDNCVNCLNNRQNFCLNWQAVGVTLPGGMQQFVVVPEKAVFNIEDLSFERGAFVEPLSCVLHGIERVHIKPGDHIVIFGAGPIGNLLMQMAGLQGASYISVLETNPSRAALALELGANRVVHSLEELKVNQYDVVIDATGVLALMNRTIDFARSGGTVLLFGVPPKRKNLELEAFKIFNKGLTVLSSYTSVRNSYQAVNLLRSEQIRVDSLISHRLPLKELPQAIEMIQKKDPQVRKVMMLPNGEESS